MTTHAGSTRIPTTGQTRRRLWRWRPDQQWEAYLFLLPSFLGFLVFVALPVIVSLLLSFVEWNLLTQPVWVGLANYRQLLTRDPVFWQVLGNTLFFMITIVPLQLAFGLILAVILNQAIRGALVYRVIYFMPVVTTIVAGGGVFLFFLKPRLWLINGGGWDFGGVPRVPPQPPHFFYKAILVKTAGVFFSLCEEK